MSRYRLTEEAKGDLREIKTYLLHKAGARITHYVLSEITAGFIFITRTPGAGHSRNDLTDLPVKFWGVFSYLIIYDPATKPVTIARVLHSARDLEAVLQDEINRP